MSDDPISRRALVRAVARKLRQKAQQRKDDLAAAKKQKMTEYWARNKKASYGRGLEFAHRMGREYAKKVRALPPSANKGFRARYQSDEKFRSEVLAKNREWYRTNRGRILARRRELRDAKEQAK